MNRIATTRRRAPALLVTARTLQPRHHPQREPWGTIHARLDGTARTLCGISTLDWHVFWNLEFTISRPDACKACCEAAAPSRVER